ncbi:hypothetical protein N865_03560 [Intrasporangium oryzae NRRL B-24470]|uniref:DUF3152 domain-containing protein n=1 Tax=Intrasporangium oryzae NRRL B-24470 TaxID=1386089 RepID=W9GCR9_9MICO|nr:hypothetical protein N865_03560 [Intrasporangium oryzae NRRL B-24470]
MRRRRLAASLAVGLCIAADVWSVARADEQAPPPMGEVATLARYSFEVGTRPVGSGTDPADAAESVPADTGATVTAAAKAGAARVVERGSGTFTVVDVPASAVRATTSSGRLVRYTVEIEGGLGVNPTEVATTVATVLGDPRGWQTRDGVRFVNVSAAAAAGGADVDLRITLASPDTTDQLCAPLQTRGQVSCHNGGRVVLNLRRWQLGADAYGADVATYRIYLVNHEVGHGIGHGHAYCAGPGKVAPVMMQQTYGLKGCTAWPWPTPKAA